MNLALLDEQILGRLTPDPLQFAFNGKTTAHAGQGGGRPILDPVEQSQRFAQLLDAQPVTGRPRCLYLHIPFCRVRCTFCNFFQNAASPAWMETYLQHFYAEMASKAQTRWAQAAPFDAVYVGGGTPTDLNASQIQRLGEQIQRYFPLRADCEITLEGRLNGFDDRKFDAALSGGFNRFSFGVQSFDTKVRKAAKRLDDRETVLARIESLVSLNAAPIILDLLFGLPYQDEACWQRDIADFLDCGAHGVDLYQLIDMPGTVMSRMVEQGRQPPPAGTPQKARMYAYGAAALEAAGLQRLSVCHWARDSRERSRYNSLAKTSADVLPIGAGAGGQINGVALMQHRVLESYQTQCAEGRWPLAMMMAPAVYAARDGLLKASFDRGLLDHQRLADAGFPHLFAQLRPLLAAWADRGLLQLDDQQATLTLAGRFWSVNLAQGALQALATYDPAAAAQQRPGHPGGHPAHGQRPAHAGHPSMAGRPVHNAHPGHTVPPVQGELPAQSVPHHPDHVTPLQKENHDVTARTDFGPDSPSTGSAHPGHGG